VGVKSSDLLIDAFTRIRGVVQATARGLTPDQLAARPDGEANSIAWLVWHLTRIQDDHLADAMGVAQVWTSQGWFERFGLALDPSDTGYGHGSSEVAAVRVEAELLTAYHDAVYEQTIEYVEGLSDADLDRIVDRSWDPPVSLGVRLISVISDDLQHAGQAAYVAGLLKTD
jgi:uncharacterized damage-inducible protein DinB